MVAFLYFLAPKNRRAFSHFNLYRLKVLYTAIIKQGLIITFSYERCGNETQLIYTVCSEKCPVYYASSLKQQAFTAEKLLKLFEGEDYIYAFLTGNHIPYVLFPKIRKISSVCSFGNHLNNLCSVISGVAVRILDMPALPSKPADGIKCYRIKAERLSGTKSVFSKISSYPQSSG